MGPKWEKLWPLCCQGEKSLPRQVSLRHLLVWLFGLRFLLTATKIGEPG